MHTAGKTLAQSWLPEVVAAGLGEYAAPPAPAAAVTQPSAHDAPTVYPPPSPPVAAPGLPLPAAGLAKTEALQAGDAAQPARKRLPRLALIGGAAAVVIAVIAIAATLLPGNGAAGNNSPGGGGGHHLTAGPSQGTNLSAGAGKSPSASPSPTLAADLDPCLIGTWKSVNANVINQINGQPTEFIGQGPTATYRANGTGKTDYGKRTVFRATVNGNKWTYIITGYIAWHWRIRGGEERDSHPREHGTLALFDNGVYNNGGPLRLGSGPGRYTCSGNTLQYFSNIGSETLIRVQPKPQRGS
jgi:hypothetical protein